MSSLFLLRKGINSNKKVKESIIRNKDKKAARSNTEPANLQPKADFRDVEINAGRIKNNMKISNGSPNEM